MKEGCCMTKFRVLCIKDFVEDAIVYWRKNKFYDVIDRDDGLGGYRAKHECGEGIIYDEDFAEYFQKIPNFVHLELKAEFSTDGDFHFDDTRLKEIQDSRQYDEAKLSYTYWHDGEDIVFHLIAEGKSDSCRYAARDLIEEMQVSFRTFSLKHYLIKDVYEMLETVYNEIWKYENVDVSDYMSGNYDGTEVRLIIREIDEPKEEPIVEEQKPTNWIPVTEYGLKKLKCPRCGSTHPDSEYVRSFTHCPNCGKIL